MTRILHVCEIAQGGVGTYIGLIWAARRAGDDHRLVIPEGEASNVSCDMPRVVFADPGRGAGRVAGLIRQTRMTVAEFQPDIVFLHSTFSMALLPVLRLMRFRGKVIYCAHGWAQSRYDGGAKRRIARLIEGRLPGLADRVLNISDFDLRLARDSGYAGHHVMIENAARDVPAADRGAFDGAGAGIDLLFVGRVARQKGLDLLLPAFQEARSRRRDLRLHVVGDVPDAISAEPRDGVAFLGWQSRDAIARFYASADAVIVPSRWEGFGLVVAEALAQGTPALVSDRGALPEVIENGVSGLVFALDHAALVNCLCALDAAGLTQMRSAARARFEARFRLQRFGVEINALFDALSG